MTGMMVGRWILDNWFTLLQSTGIVGSLLFTAYTIRQDNRSQRVANLLTVTQHHRDIWSEAYQRPDLHRVLADSINVDREPVTPAEELFVRLLILHLSGVFLAGDNRELFGIQGLQADVQWFFSLPVPTTVWNKFRRFQDAKFVAFVEASLSAK